MKKLMWNEHDDEVCDVIDNITEWTFDYGYEDFYNFMSGRILGQKNLSIVCANVFSYLRAASRGSFINQNMLLAAPSGTGKTETFRAMKDYFNETIPSLPVFMIDTTQLTPSGFKGANLEDVFAPLITATNGTDSPIAIVFLDEFDKRLMNMDVSADSFNKTIQYNLLSILEGANIYDKSKDCIDTSHILFIGMGSFDDFRQTRTEVKRSIGFNTENVVPADYSSITRDTLLEMSTAPELVGRFSHVVNYSALSSDSIDAIIDKLTLDLSLYHECDIIIKKPYRDMLHTLSKSKFGCRAFNNRLSEDILSVIPEALLHKKNDILTVTLSDRVTYRWRKFSQKELKSMKCMEDFLSKAFEKLEENNEGAQDEAVVES